MLASLQLLGPGGSVSRVLHDPQRLLVRGKGSVAQVLRAWERGGMVRSSQLRGHTGGGCGRGGGSSTPNSLTPLTCMAWRCCPSFKFSAWNCLFFTLAFSRVAREFLTCQKSKGCRQHASPDDHGVRLRDENVPPSRRLARDDGGRKPYLLVQVHLSAVSQTFTSVQSSPQVPPVLDE